MLEKKWQKKYDDRERDFGQIRTRTEKSHEKEIDRVKEEMSQEVGAEAVRPAGLAEPAEPARPAEPAQPEDVQADVLAARPGSQTCSIDHSHLSTVAVRWHYSSEVLQ